MSTNSENRKSEVLQEFDSGASRHSTSREQEPWFLAQLRIVLRMMENKQGTVLDIGCAAGAEVAALRAHHFRVVGVDCSPAMLAYSRQRFADDACVQLCRADMENLPFASSSFDHVVCLGVLEYVPSYIKSLDEIHRVLRPGGLAVFSIPTRISAYQISEYLARLLTPFWRACKAWLGGRPFRPLPRQWNYCVPWRFRALLREQGFEPRTSAYSGFILYALEQWWPAMELRLFESMERFSKSRLLGWALSQYLISAYKRG